MATALKRAIRMAMLSRSGKRRRHVFVVGMERSGTTMLRRTLEIQPPFGSRAAPSPETFIFASPHELLTRQNLRGLHYIDDAEVRDRLLRETRLALRLSNAMLHAPVRLGGLLESAAQIIDRQVIRLFFEEQRISLGSPRLVEKTPSHLLHVESILAAFPRGKIVCTVRHPVTRFASYRKRLAVSDEQDVKNKWLAISVSDFATHYRRDAMVALRYSLEMPEQFRVYRYEDITESPTTVLPALFSWLGAEFDPEVDRDRSDGALDVGLGETNLGHQVHTARALSPASAATGDWRQWVDEEEVETIERLTALEMIMLGYQHLDG